MLAINYRGRVAFNRTGSTKKALAAGAVAGVAAYLLRQRRHR